MSRDRVGRRRSLRGQVVAVTGAARGVGAALARSLHARGAKVALLGLEPQELERVAAPLGEDAAWWEADVTDEATLRDVAARVTEHFGRIDTAVVNAGVAASAPFLSSDPVTFDRVIEVNLLGSVATARAFLPELVRSRGYLLQVASLAAITPSPMMAAYCASKAGAEAFAHCLRVEVAGQGVRVGVAYLSWTDTDMVRGADRSEVAAKMRASLPYPLNRTYPLEPSVERITDGIARRSAHVYGQGWLRLMQPLRGMIPAVVAAAGPARIARYRDEIDAAGDMGLVGAGGAADAEARQARAAPGGGRRQSPGGATQLS